MLRAMTAISFQQNCGSANLRQEHDAICDWVFDKDPDFKAFEEGTTKLDRADMEKAKDLSTTLRLGPHHRCAHPRDAGEV